MYMLMYSSSAYSIFEKDKVCQSMDVWVPCGMPIAKIAHKWYAFATESEKNQSESRVHRDINVCQCFVASPRQLLKCTTL